jgi:Amino acid permease
VREAGVIFMVPTYLFLGTLLWVIIVGTIKTALAGGHPLAVVAPPPPASPAIAVASAWILLQVFSNGCTAMTGVEAVSNGVRAFREPAVKEAQRALTVIIGLLIVLLIGIAYLVRAYGIAATDPGQPGYQSVLSMLVGAVLGRGWFYYVTIGAVLLILCLSANTAFADFPRLCRAVAQNSFLPHSFGYRGRRLVYTEGILVLAVLSAILLTLFGGVTDRLIPLFAIGAFTAFTLSQAGMVGHWIKQRGPGATKSMIINGLGAVATGITTLVVLVAKFSSGAWVSALLIALMVVAMLWVRHHYRDVNRELASSSPLSVDTVAPPLVVVTIQNWGKIAQRALQFALTLSSDIRAVHVTTEDEINPLREEWGKYVEDPVKRAGRTPPELVVLPSPYRLVIRPIVDYVLKAEKEHPNRQIAIIVPELVERHWYHYPLHNQRAEILKALLLVHGSDRIVLINVPWYLKT